MAEWYVKWETKNCRVYPKLSELFESDRRIVVIQARFPTRKKAKKIFSKNIPSEISQDVCTWEMIHLFKSSTAPNLTNSWSLNWIRNKLMKWRNSLSMRLDKPLKKPSSLSTGWTKNTKNCNEKDPTKRKSLANDVKKLRTWLKNAYFKINLARKQR